MQPSQKNIIELIKENWVAIAFFTQLIMTYSFINNNINDHEKRLMSLEKYKDSNITFQAEIQARLSSIETSLSFIKAKIQ